MDINKIYPQIVTDNIINQSPSNLVRKAVLSNLVAYYVEDNGQLLTPVSTEHLADMKLEPDNLHSIAVKNLLTLTEASTNLHIMDNGDGTKAVSFEALDYYDSARFLLLFTPYLDKFVQILGDPFYVAIPCRDFLLAVPSKFEQRLVNYASQLYASKPKPITKEIFLFSKNESTFLKN